MFKIREVFRTLLSCGLRPNSHNRHRHKHYHRSVAKLIIFFGFVACAVNYMYLSYQQAQQEDFLEELADELDFQQPNANQKIVNSMKNLHPNLLGHKRLKGKTKSSTPSTATQQRLLRDKRQSQQEAATNKKKPAQIISRKKPTHVLEGNNKGGAGNFVKNLWNRQFLPMLQFKQSKPNSKAPKGTPRFPSTAGRAKKVTKPSKPVFTEDPMLVLNYGPSRIPGYINVWGNDTRALYGHVMRELVRRVCARQIAQSNILVYSPRAPQVVPLAAAKELGRSNKNNGSISSLLRPELNHEVGACALLDAHVQGHESYGFNTTNGTLDEFWTNAKQQSASPPGWFLMAMIDHGFHNDDIVKNAITFLQEATVTYIVLGVGANSTGKDATNMYGEEAIRQLINLKYKVQLLSLSHEAPPAINQQLFKPNGDITKGMLPLFFGQLRSWSKSSGTPVLGYVFATQGLDLAIPTAMRYKPVIQPKQGVTYMSCPQDSNSLQVKFHGLAPHHIVEKLDEASKRFLMSERDPVKVSCAGKRINHNTSTGVTDAWYSDETLETSEAFCLRMGCENVKQAACTTRILPKSISPSLNTDENKDGAVKENAKQESRKPKPNLLLVMLDPISRARFERSLVKTNNLLQRLNFTSFSQYTAVGNNSGPNQAALYSGTALKTRESIASHNTQKKTQWLWDTLRDHGYATFKAEDGCVENSNMIQSIQPQVHHGDALLQMMCFDFQRPNCIGSKAAAQHLIDYGSQFIRAYNDRKQSWAAMMHFIDSHEDTQILEGTLDDPLWKFLYSIYSGQICKAEYPYHHYSVDCDIWKNTLIMFISDHGLHYGSYLMSPKGLKERSQPMLHVHLPEQLSYKKKILRRNSKGFISTPFDVHETILDVLLSRTKSPSNDATGSSLLEALPNTRQSCSQTPGIPEYICDILKDDPTSHVLMPSPPSVMSFFSDIPRMNKKFSPVCKHQASNATIFTKGDVQCVCGTSQRSWYNCSSHPWSNPNDLTKSETFSMVDCNTDRSFEIQVQRDPNVLNRPETEKVRKVPRRKQPPSILLLELDSVSTAFADRHFPRTRELVKSMRLRRHDTDMSGFSCNANETWCAAEFQQFSVVGPSSIPNQIAAFGGCIVTVGTERCSVLAIDAHNRTICKNETHPVYGYELINRHRKSATFCRLDKKNRSPWIFDIARAMGYVTLFGEEFCYDGSPYVPQGNVFPLDADILPSKFYCRVTERRATTMGFKMRSPDRIWEYAYAPDPSKPWCVDERGGYETTMVGLDHIETMWDAYHDIPKLAYLNTISAHEYRDFDKMSNRAETYDITVSSFLKRMLARPDMENTIVVLRADHGLQAGPQTADYSIQIEALRPWTELIVPKKLADVSLENLFENQNRLATGFDLYKTLTSSIVGEDSSIMPRPASWMHHLWKDVIDESRTCQDAGVSADYCLFESQRTFSAPNLRTCNQVESEQELVCPPLAETFKAEMSVDVNNTFYTKSEIQDTLCPPNTKSVPPIPNSLLSQWTAINDTRHEHYTGNMKKDDSTIKFVQPRQASILSKVVSELSGAVYQAENRSFHVCQTGFGAGHSAAMFLDASPTVKVHALSTQGKPYHEPIIEQLQEHYGMDRLEFIKGNPCVTTTRYMSPIAPTVSSATDDRIRCDFLYGALDNTTICRTETTNLISRAPCGVLVSSAATMSLHDTTVYFGPGAQWAWLRSNGCIKDITCFEEDETVEQRPRKLGNSTAMKVHYKFCLAVTTGKCNVYDDTSVTTDCKSKIAEISRRIVLNQVCPAHETVTPPPVKNPTKKLPIKK